ncbi:MULTISPECIES: type VII secretion protein EccE [Mycobacteriaceae]|uniref:Type VII secretion protein EccE n=4 Tax=Mycobacteriaceae TaxID=1762 RepID=A0A7I9Y8F2_MYCAL|nr:type VII secretion protein EccE [Mycolicibacter algericus]OQZ92016.1 type VII secretion protein EccE [Mycolicibacter algericus DSM 45454]BBX15073.1 type VII secretion protein EccE [Mycobacterium novum]GFG84877.1 type VII secretion protein EccE [Mycolicibacter algericus]
MKAQHAVGLNLSWTRVTIVFLIDIGILVLAGRWPGDEQVAVYAWWSGVGVAVLVAIIALVTYRQVPISTMWAAWFADQFADTETALSRGRTPAVDHHRRFGREPIGMREHQGRLVTVIAVGGRPVQATGRHRRGLEPAALPLERLAGGLRQFDVRLDSIDIVSVGTRSAPRDSEDVDFDDTPSMPDHRRTWLVLRMDPQHNVNAVAARDSLAATLTAATERLAEEIDGRLISARPLRADEFDDVDEATLAGLEAAQLSHRLFRNRPEGHVTNFWLSPADITDENLEHLWYPETDATVVTVRLAPGGGRTTSVSVLVRYHSAGKLGRNVRAALNRFVGRRQLEAVCASLPAPTSHPRMPVPGRDLQNGEHLVVSVDALQEYAVPASGTRP